MAELPDLGGNRGTAGAPAHRTQSDGPGAAVKEGRRRGGRLRVLMLYVAVVALLYAPVLFGGKSLLAPLFVPHGTLPDGVYAAKGRNPANTFNIDIATPAYYEAPINRLVGDIYLSAELPLWNPFQAAGTPLAAQYSTRAFFPYQILEDISPAYMWDFFMLGRLVIAGFFTYLFLFAVGLSPGAAFFGGLLYMLSGTFAWFINLEQYANTAMMLPVLLYATELLAAAAAGGRGANNRWKALFSRPTAFAGIAIGLLLLAGQPEVALYASALAFLWFTLRVLKCYGLKELLPSLGRFGFAYLLGLFFAAPLLLLFIELFLNSYHIHPPGGSIGMEGLVNWRSLFAYLTPAGTLFPADPEMIVGGSLLVEYQGLYRRFLPINGVWDTLGGFSGIVPVYITCAGLALSVLRRRFAYRAELYFFTAIFLTVLLKNLKVAPFVWIGALPLFDMVWSLRWAGPVLIFSLCAASAFSLELLGNATCRRRADAENGDGAPVSAKRIGPGAVAVAVFALLALFYLLYSFIPVTGLVARSASIFNPAMEPYVRPSLLYSSIVTLVLLVCVAAGLYIALMPRYKGRFALVGALCALAFVELWWAVPRGYGADWLGCKWLPFSLGLGGAVLLFFNRRAVALFALLLFFISALYIDFASPFGLPDRQPPFAPAPYVDFIKKRPGNYRAVGFYGALFPNFASALKLYDVHYVNSLVPSTFNDFRKYYLSAEPLDEGPNSVLWFTGRPERSIVNSGYQSGGPRYKSHSSPVEDDIIHGLRSYSQLGVKYLIFPAKRDAAVKRLMGLKGADGGPLFPVLYDREVLVLMNGYALDRAYMVYATEVAGSYTEAQRLASSFGFDIKRSAVTEVKVGLESDKTAGVADSGNRNRSVLITGYSANTVTVEVESGKEGLLVLSDTYYPGWKAYVNGKETEIVRVNGLVRAVLVGSKRSTVLFKYSPAGFRSGLALFLLAGAVTGYIFIAGDRSRGRAGNVRRG